MPHQQYGHFVQNLELAIHVVEKTIPISMKLQLIPFHVAFSHPFRDMGMDPLDNRGMDGLFGPQANEYLWTSRRDCLMDQTMTKDMKRTDRELVKNRLGTRRSEYTFCLNMQRRMRSSPQIHVLAM